MPKLIHVLFNDCGIVAVAAVALSVAMGVHSLAALPQ